MSEMIERVAKAIYEEDDPWHKAWPWPNLNESQGSPEPYRRIAAAAIKAMRYTDADEAIAIKSGQAIGVDAVLAIEAHDAWIDAALVGKG